MLRHRHYRYATLAPGTRYKPIQLLLPPGLCSAVCPIFTTPSCGRTSSFPVSTSKGNASTASTSGLDTDGDIDTASSFVAKDGGRREKRSTGVIAPDGDGDVVAVTTSATGACTGKNDSAHHSYHTCRLFVSRQIDTCSSELLGRYNGSCDGRPEVSLVMWQTDKQTNLEREEQREPAKHIFRGPVFPVWMDTQIDTWV